MHVQLKHFFFVCFYLLHQIGFAQIDTISSKEADSPINIDLLENNIENNASSGEFDFNSLFEELEEYTKRPLNLNKADRQTLEETNLFSSIQIEQLLNYRKQYGNLISIYELQAVEGFHPDFIRQILPFVNVNSSLDDIALSPFQMMSEGRNELITRWTRVLEQKKGYIPLENDSTPYIGDPNRLYLRYKHTYSNKLSYGFTAEKDPGEAFFRANNTQGFDFYSGHFYLKNYNARLKAIALGDFNASFGQGLILFTGFARGKGAEVNAIKRNANPLRGYSSVGEAVFLRGAGISIGINDNLEATVFGSFRNRDGNIIDLSDTDIDLQESQLLFSSFQTSGFHRTAAEIADKGQLKQQTYGASLKFKNKRFHLALNGLFNKFDKTLNRRQDLYNQYYFNGDQLLNLSVDYGFVWRNINFFGETARSDNGGWATINGMNIGLDTKVDFSVLHRHFERDYQALDANPFAETGGARNETGWYMGFEIRPKQGWKWSNYADIFKHPWLRFRVDAPSSGFEYFSRLTYTKRKKWESYLQFRFERKERNAVNNDTNADFIVPIDRYSARWHIAYTLNKQLQFRNRVELSYFDEQGQSLEKGYLIYQDIIYKPSFARLTISGRFALFDVDDFDARIYAYENSLVNEFLVPFYNFRGTRYYINIRYKGIRRLTLEARYSRTYQSNQDSFSSGNELILGPTKSEVRAQLRYVF